MEPFSSCLEILDGMYDTHTYENTMASHCRLEMKRFSEGGCGERESEIINA